MGALVLAFAGNFDVGRSEMKIFVLGAGMMGRAVVHDLAGAQEVRQIVVGDFDRSRAAEVAK